MATAYSFWACGAGSNKQLCVQPSPPSSEALNQFERYLVNQERYIQGTVKAAQESILAYRNRRAELNQEQDALGVTLKSLEDQVATLGPQVAAKRVAGSTKEGQDILGRQIQKAQFSGAAWALGVGGVLTILLVWLGTRR